MQIEGSDLAAISQLWHELAEIPAGQADVARDHCFGRLCEIVGAQNAFWVGSAREVRHPSADDVMRGWRPKAAVMMYSYPGLERRISELMREIDANIVDPMTLANNQFRGRLRAFLRNELVEDDVWERSALVTETLRPIGVADRIIGTRPVTSDRESFIGLDRAPGERRFGERERDLLHLFLMGCPGFHREQLMARGVADPPLTRREREVLALLLTDLPEREIAAALGLTWRTTHQYVVSICKKLGVRGRIGVMASALRHPPAS